MKEADIKKEAIKVLEREKYLYWFPPFPANKTAQRDIFGVFDFVAIRGEYLTFVQLTTIGHISDRRKKIMELMANTYVSIPQAYIWAWDNDNGNFRFIKAYENFV